MTERVVYDDGSTLTYDGAGNVIAMSDSSGAAQSVPPPGGSAIVRQFSDLFNYGVRAVIDREFRSQPAAVSPAVAGAPMTQPNWQRYVPLLMIVGGGIIAYKLLR